jgi:glycosyltransferase involved in cell wall biosynthesis
MIITPLCEAGDFVEKYGIGFQYNPNQIESIYNTIIELSENKSKMNTLVKNISEIKHHFSREKIADHFTQLLVNQIHKSYDKKSVTK